MMAYELIINRQNPFEGDQDLRRMIKYFVRTYNTIKKKLELIDECDPLSVVNDKYSGLPKGTDIIKSTEEIAIKRATAKGELEKQKKVIDRARGHIDSIYREAVWLVAVEDMPLHVAARHFYVQESTLRSHISQFYYEIGLAMGWIIPDYAAIV